MSAAREVNDFTDSDLDDVPLASRFLTTDLSCNRQVVSTPKPPPPTANVLMIDDSSTSESRLPTEEAAEAKKMMMQMMLQQQETNRAILELLNKNNPERQEAPVITAPSSTAVSTFKLINFDPDDSPYTMKEWIDRANRIKIQFNVPDEWMLLKVSEALQGRAAKYLQQWRPRSQDWETFVTSLETAFPEVGSHFTRAQTMINVRSNEFKNLSDYGNTKLCEIRRFYDKFPWDIVLNIVEGCLDNLEAQSSIRVLQPSNEAELLKLLARCDASKNVMENNRRSGREDNLTNLRWRKRYEPYRKFENTRKQQPPFTGTCHGCNKVGHKQFQCPMTRPSTSKVNDTKNQQSQDVKKKR